jgi:molybdenum-dependent DNA-binding transcriptional regulator ModE
MTTHPTVKLSLIYLLMISASVLQAQQTPSMPPAEDLGVAMDGARSLLQKWAETQRLIASERGEWEQGKSVLQSRIQLLQSSLAENDKKMKEAREKLAEAKTKTAEANEQKKQVKEASDALLELAPKLEKGVRDLCERVPTSVQEKVKILLERMPKEGAEVKNITAAERMQNVLGILNELNKANTEIASLPEIQDIGGGRKAEVKAVYLGLGQGYYVNAAGDMGGRGTPAAGAWKWAADPSIAKKMIEVLDVMKKTVAPKLVELPATIE